MTEITIFNSREHKMKNENTISKEHIANNKTVRNTLISRGITPENLPPEEDVKKIERKLKSEKKNRLKMMIILTILKIKIISKLNFSSHFIHRFVGNC